MMAIVSLVALLIAGLATRSDALVIGWVSGVGAIIIAIIMQYIKTHLRIPVSAVMVMLVLVMVIVLLSAVLMSQDIIMEVYGAGSEQHLQAYRRFDLWVHGVLAGLDSPLFGLGPGNHSGFVAPHTGSEAHNSFIDWFTISGIIGLVAFVSIIVLSLKIIVKHNLFLFGALVSIVIFSSFHYMLRHPFFWFTLIVAHQAASLIYSRCVRYGKCVPAL
ncbi:uncharacterized protein FOKN1_2170 [Thiohalobacter thiocyanaticus]|uniref:O-antigen ligase-related domain-containing protein n=2 Tax=Thiohalobacter thiocyanaticus TaxID=585455 RepID=A0A1Z4VSD5_9GAMM|nr:uncharacterized protein FOKN1_2170 [Thiohalobacter thiocyanaticus]